MENQVVTYGSRIKFIKEGNTMVSAKIYTNGVQSARVVIDTEKVTFKLIEPNTGVTLKDGPEGITNLEVLQRHVKKTLKSYLGIRFDKETRQKKQNV